MINKPLQLRYRQSRYTKLTDTSDQAESKRVLTYTSF